MIRFTCPHCRSVLTAHVRFVGQGIQCSQCKQLLKVPDPPVAKIASSNASSRGKIVTIRKVLACLFLVLLGFLTGRLTRPTLSSTGGSPDSPLLPAATTADGRQTGEDEKQRVDRRPRLVEDRERQADKANKDNGRLRRLWDPDKLSAKLSGRTFAEVRALLGDPDQVAGPTPGADPDEDNEDLWVYKGILRDPKTGGTNSALWMIRFRFGRVYLSCIPWEPKGQLTDGGGVPPNQIRP